MRAPRPPFYLYFRMAIAAGLLCWAVAIYTYLIVLGIELPFAGSWRGWLTERVTVPSGMATYQEVTMQAAIGYLGGFLGFAFVSAAWPWYLRTRGAKGDGSKSIEIPPGRTTRRLPPKT